MPYTNIQKLAFNQLKGLRMINTLKAAAPSNAARGATPTVAHNNQEQADLVQGMTAEQRRALMDQLKLAQREDVRPLEQRRAELEAELTQLNEQIRAMKPVEDTLAVFRAVRRAVKTGNESLDDIADAAGYDVNTVEAMLTKHLTGKDDKAPIFTLKEDKYKLTRKAKKS